MIAVHAFQPEDLAAMTVQVAQAEVRGDRIAQARALSAGGRCFTVRDAARHRILMCGGALESHPRYATMWAAFAPDAGAAMLAITRRARWYIATCLDHARVDAIVRLRHDAGHDWMAMLGFRPEVALGQYFEDGDDAMIYRLVR